MVKEVEKANANLSYSAKAAAFLQDIIFEIASFFSYTMSLISVKAMPELSKAQREEWKKDPSNLPNASDLVRFELREVFKDPFRSQQLSPKPSDSFRDYMRELGYDKYWSDSYWAAHWSLPPVNQAFEMFWRLRPGRVSSAKPFNRADLESLLKRLDIMPSYHEQLIEIAYQPVTRVDIRRMYRLGIFDKDEVAERYKDLGYSDHDAQIMARFIEKDVAPDESAVTLSEMKNGFMDGVISRSELIAWLNDAGYSTPSITLMFRLLDARLQKPTAAAAPKKLTKADIVSGFNEGLLSDAEAVSQLQSIGYNSISAQYIIDIEKAQLAKKLKK